MTGRFLMTIIASSLLSITLTGQSQWPETLPFKPDDGHDTITMRLDPPTVISRPSTFRPPLIAYLTYCNLGLYIGVHDSLGVFELHIARPWSQPIFGIRIGD